MFPIWKTRINLVVSIFLVILLLVLGSPLIVTQGTSQATSLTRRVNIPYLQELPFEPAIFWFGKVDPSYNSADVRIWYYDDYLIVTLHIIDRLHWYDNTGNISDLTNWDAVSLYFNLEANGGIAPTSHSYRLDAQLDGLQASYLGNGSSWQIDPFFFDVETVWRGDQGPNSGVDGKGWQVTYSIPFSSFGLSAKPPEGTIWGLAAILHDRDDANGINIFHTTWPETMNPINPSSWGQMSFGKANYNPPVTESYNKFTIRNGKDGVEVVDAAVGGHTTCGDGLDHWIEWGDENYEGYTQFNIQNQWDVSDWPCFSKYYVTFPLDSLPPGKEVLSATLTLTLFGNAGGGQWGEPLNSYIHVFTIGEDWDEGSLSWNNAPLALENISGTWVYPRDYELPDQPYHWDISKAVHQAYSSGGPLRLALYSIDGEMHSGKYFWTSDWNSDGVPYVTILLGEQTLKINKEADHHIATNGEKVHYTLTWKGSGEVQTMLDQLPNGLSEPSNIAVNNNGLAIYDPGKHQIQWTGTPAQEEFVTLTYQVSVQTEGPKVLLNYAELSDTTGLLSGAKFNLFIDPYLVFLPVNSK